MTIAVVIRECTYLKVLAPIMHALHKHGQDYILYHWDAPRYDKEYNRASFDKINAANKDSVQNAKKVKAFSNDQQLLKQFKHDKISKLVSLEIWLWAKSYIKKLKSLNIKLFSVLYLTDSLWQKDPSAVNAIDHIYYSTKFLMETYHKFAELKYDKKRDHCLGSSIFDDLTQTTNGKNILLLLPNLRKEHVELSFGTHNNFIRIIEKLAGSGVPIICKSRKKQWVPNEILQYVVDIVDDGDVMYPSVISKLLRESFCSVMFHSSGIYECVYSGNYVVNIKLPLQRWSWDKNKMTEYFNGGLYNFQGVVESLDQKEILDSKWNFNPSRINPKAQQKWIESYIGINYGSDQIASHIIEH